jgi:hypothetical protein
VRAYRRSEKRTVPSDPVLAEKPALANLRGTIAKIASGESLSQDEAAQRLPKSPDF